MQAKQVKARAIQMIENGRGCQLFGSWMLQLFERPAYLCFQGERRFDVECQKVGAQSKREFVLTKDTVGWLMFRRK